MESFIKDEWIEVKKSFPKLRYLNENKSGWSSIGEIDIIDESGILWRTFSIKIDIPKEYPGSLPVIYEIGGALECSSEWHINGDGSCCVGPNAKIYRKLEGDITIIRWLEIIVLPYFFDQVHKLEKGFYKGKEYAHGKEGLIEDYIEWWQLDSEEDVVSKLSMVTGKKKIMRNEKCFCGSGKKYKHCHLYSDNYLGVPIEIYNRDLLSILEH